MRWTPQVRACRIVRVEPTYRWALGIAIALVGVVIGLAAWLWPRSAEGPPTFESDLGSTQDVASFDKFVREHDNERVRLSLRISSDVVGEADDSGKERGFVLGNIACDPSREACLDRYHYRLVNLRRSDLETTFGWGGPEQGYVLRGTYFVAGHGIGTGGIVWRTLQAVSSGSS